MIRKYKGLFTQLGIILDRRFGIVFAGRAPDIPEDGREEGGTGTVRGRTKKNIKSSFSVL